MLRCAVCSPARWWSTAPAPSTGWPARRLLVHGEDARADGAVATRAEENALELPQFLGEDLHLLRGKQRRLGKHAEAVSAEGPRRKDVDLEEAHELQYCQAPSVF